MKGSQLYFPKDYDVAIAPVRRDDLPALLEESVRLAPMDLERDADADVMVLVPLGDSDFALRARQLELPPEFIERSTGKLARINALALRLFALPQVHRLDTDADTWRAIWDLVRPEELVYVRRPPRTAETNVSAVVLAKGMPLPPPGSGPLVDGAALESQLDAALEKAAGLQATVADLQIKDADQKKRIADLEQSLALGNDVRLAEALAKAADLDGQVQALQAKVQGLESGERNAAILSTALAAATDKITQLSGDLERAQKRIAELQATGATLPDDVQKRIDALTQQVSDLNQTIRTLQAGAEDGAAHLNEAKLKIDQLSAQLDEAKRALGDSGTALAARTAERDAALAESAQAKVDLGNAQDQVNRQQVALDQTQKALQAAQDDRTAANNALAKALDQVNGQQLALAEAQKALQTALDDKANATQALAASQKNVTDLQASLGTSQARATSLESSVNALQARCDDLAAQLKAQSTSPLVRELGALETSNPDALATLQRMVAKNVLENANSLGIPSTSLDRWKKLAG